MKPTKHFGVYALWRQDARIDFAHTGVISHVEVLGPVVHDIAAEDVGGAVLATAADTAMFSPLVLQALRHFPDLTP